MGVRFSTYSFWWIKQAIRQALSKQRSLIRFPTHVNDQVNRIYAYKSEFLLLKGRLPTEQEIQRQLKLKQEHLRDLTSLTNLCVSANTALYDDSPRTIQDDLIYPSLTWSPEETTDQSQKSDYIKQLFSILDEREVKILTMKFGIGHRKEHSLNEISPQVGISRERVRQIIEEAMEKIRGGIDSTSDG